MAGDKKLWLQPNIIWKYGTTPHTYVAKAYLDLNLTESSPPFASLYRHSVTVEASASTQVQAKNKALESLKQKLNKPISQWLFDNEGSI